MKKVLDINMDGFHIAGYRLRNDRWNPYRVFLIYCGHRKQIARYGDFMSVLYFIKDLYRYGVDTMQTDQVIEWAKKYEATGGAME